MMDETRAYLDGEWTTLGDEEATVVFGPDGDAILVCRVQNAAHLLTPADVAAYLLELKRDRERLNWILDNCSVTEPTDVLSTRGQIDAAMKGRV